jgi:hypothetical protein
MVFSFDYEALPNVIGTEYDAKFCWTGSLSTHLLEGWPLMNPGT